MRVARSAGHDRAQNRDRPARADLGLPDTHGIDVIRELRSWTEVPVIVLSARTH
ncbi:hypothetical protein BURKHO8Y_150204 [Burkholderia sp. 8Y]|nr:hypothetical protein BURKHO8Y_150204 [Burkholderia sp. 8Y]